MQITIIRQPIPRADLANLAKTGFGDMIKAVIDIERGIMAVGGEETEDWVESDSMINVRPAQNYRSRRVEDKELRARILQLIDQLVMA